MMHGNAEGYQVHLLDSIELDVGRLHGCSLFLIDQSSVLHLGLDAFLLSQVLVHLEVEMMDNIVHLQAVIVLGAGELGPSVALFLFLLAVGASFEVVDIQV